MASLADRASDEETDEDEFHDAVGGGESEDDDEGSVADGWMEDVGMPRHRSSSRKEENREPAGCQASDGTFADAMNMTATTELTPAQLAMAVRYGTAAATVKAKASNPSGRALRAAAAPMPGASKGGRHRMTNIEVEGNADEEEEAAAAKSKAKAKAKAKKARKMAAKDPKSGEGGGDTTVDVVELTTPEDVTT